MLRAAMEVVTKINVVQAQLQLKQLVSPLLEYAIQNGHSVKTGIRHPRAYHIIGLIPNERTPEETIEMAKRLKERGIVLAIRCGGFRVFPQITYTENDVKHLIEGLKEF